MGALVVIRGSRWVGREWLEENEGVDRQTRL